MSDKDWKTLKQSIERKGLRIVSLDVPTSWQAINNMLIDLMAAMTRKDYLTRRDRQALGIERAKKEGKY